MLTPPHIWLVREPVDMRQGIDTLTQYVTDRLTNSGKGTPLLSFAQGTLTHQSPALGQARGPAVSSSSSSGPLYLALAR